MTKEDIILMAREAGLMAFKYPDLISKGDWENLERFAALVAAAAIKDAPDYKMGYADGAAAEREELEKIDWTVLMRQGGVVTWGDAETLGDRVIDAIRARGNHD